MERNTFFVTTPIYYSNWIPHIGHAYSSIIADIIAKYKRINWKEVKFSTWVDENSQKVVEKAQENNMEIMEYADMMASKHKEVWDWLGINYTDFIRTTESRHHKLVQEVLQKSFEKWDIYEWTYEWLYCVWCESYKKPSDLNADWCCPDHLTKPNVIKEKNWFFALSKYQKALEDFYKENDNFIIPQYRANEVIEFIKWWLEDFSISRESNKFWIRLPFDNSQVTYVWYDALFNYVTVCQWEDSKFWPADLHIVWKDIIRFHAIYWPAMLMSAWYEPPKNILTTWFFTVDWQKISKSLWNAIDPVEFTNKYSKDLLTLYLLSAFPIWQDWDFSQDQAVLMYNAKLANTLWNLLNRVIVLTLKLWEENLNWTFDRSNIEIRHPEIIFSSISDGINELKTWYIEAMSSYDLKWALDKVFSFLNNLNTFMNATSPWEMFADIDNKKEEIRDILFTVAECLRVIWILLYPFFEEKMSELLTRLWLSWYPEDLKNWNFVGLLEDKVVFNIKEKWDALYPRI